MPVRFIIFLVYLFISLHTVFSLAQLDSSLASLTVNCATDTTEGCAQTNAINRIPFISLVEMNEIGVLGYGIISVPIPSASFFDDMKTLLLWDYPFFNGNWFFIKLFLLIPISSATMLLLAITLGPLTIAAGSLIVSVVIGPLARVLSGGVRGIVGAFN